MLSSITKKGEIESASRPLMGFGDNDNYNLGYDACKEICAGIKRKEELKDQRRVPNYLSMVLELIEYFGLKFEYRKHRTIKGDVLDWSKLSKCCT